MEKMTVGVAPYWTKDTVKSPEISRDGLVVRGEDLATFTLPIDPTSKMIIQNEGEPVQVPTNFKYTVEFAGDREIRRVLQSPPPLSTAIRSLVVVLVVKEDASGRTLQTLGSGVALSHRIIFTAEHLFHLGPGEKLRSINLYVDDGYKGDSTVEEPKAGLKAMKMELPDSVNRVTILEAFNVDEWECAWEDFLDFAVLKTETPLPFPEDAEFLRIEDSAPSRRSLICAIGVPGKPVDSSSVFDLISISLKRSLLRQAILPSTRSKLFQELYCKAMHGFGNPIGSFGCVKNGGGEVSAESAYYGLGTFTSANGMSGGPVVALDDPDKLVGIVVGSLSSASSNAYLRADAPPVLAAYRHFVTDSRS